MQRKSTTTNDTAESKAAQIKNTRQLTEAVDVLLSNPETPEELWDAVADSIFELSGKTNVSVQHPEVARVAFPLMLKQAATGKPYDPTESPGTDALASQKNHSVSFDGNASGQVVSSPEEKSEGDKILQKRKVLHEALWEMHDRLEDFKKLGTARGEAFDITMDTCLHAVGLAQAALMSDLEDFAGFWKLLRSAVDELNNGKFDMNLHREADPQADISDDSADQEQLERMFLAASNPVKIGLMRVAVEDVLGSPWIPVPWGIKQNVFARAFSAFATDTETPVWIRNALAEFACETANQAGTRWEDSEVFPEVLRQAVKYFNRDKAEAEV